MWLFFFLSTLILMKAVRVNQNSEVAVQRNHDNEVRGSEESCGSLWVCNNKRRPSHVILGKNWIKSIVCYLLNPSTTTYKKIHLVDTHVPSTLGGTSAVILTLSCRWRYWQPCSHCRLSLRLEEEVKEAVGTSHSLLPVPATNTA